MHAGNSHIGIIKSFYKLFPKLQDFDVVLVKWFQNEFRDLGKDVDSLIDWQL